MQDRTTQNRRAGYAGRFADAAGGASSRASASARPRSAANERPRGTTSGGASPRARSAATRDARRPSGFAAPEPPKRRPAAQPARPSQPDSKRMERKPRNKRTGGGPDWKKRLPLMLIALAVVIALVIVLALIFGGDSGTFHQLPRVERGSDSAYEPEETVAPEGAPTAAPAQATEIPAQAAATEVPAAAQAADVPAAAATEAPADLSGFLADDQAGALEGLEGLSESGEFDAGALEGMMDFGASGDLDASDLEGLAGFVDGGGTDAQAFMDAFGGDGA